ncbi:5,6-dimethylbenzimidazole synthase [Eionea flava]
MRSPHSYSDSEKATINKVMRERRDIRHFNKEMIDRDCFNTILSAAHLAPSVGLMQPWRFIHITNFELRKKIHQLVDTERQLTANALGEKKDEFLRLKVEGILQCSDIVIAALPDKREEHIFGRRTLPEMDLASLSCAIQNMWLTARAEGIGMGWVSLFEPKTLKHLLSMPNDSHPIAILCIGHVDQFYEKPMLVEEKWANERPLNEFICENTWKY